MNVRVGLNAVPRRCGVVRKQWCILYVQHAVFCAFNTGLTAKRKNQCCPTKCHCYKTLWLIVERSIVPQHMTSCECRLFTNRHSKLQHFVAYTENLLNDYVVYIPTTSSPHFVSWSRPSSQRCVIFHFPAEFVIKTL